MAFTKDPGEVKDYAVDWSERLSPTADTISTSTFTVPTGIVEPEEPATAATDTVATVWLSGGTPGVDYRVTNHIVTAQGREFERSFTVSVQEL